MPQNETDWSLEANPVNVTTPGMVVAWPAKPFTFRALAKTYGRMWLRCDRPVFGG
jgi:hypothetical protein